MEPEPRVATSAFRHGLLEDDIRHAVRNRIGQHRMSNDFLMAIGGDRAGNLLEVGLVNHDGDIRIVHAMAARRKFLGDHHA